MVRLLHNVTKSCLCLGLVQSRKLVFDGLADFYHEVNLTTLEHMSSKPTSTQMENLFIIKMWVQFVYIITLMLKNNIYLHIFAVNQRNQNHHTFGA